MLYKDSWKCTYLLGVPVYSDSHVVCSDIILAACDVEGNFLVVKVGNSVPALICFVC